MKRKMSRSNKRSQKLKRLLYPIGKDTTVIWSERGCMRVIDREGDLYYINLDPPHIDPEIKGLKLEPCYHPPEGLYHHRIYNSKYGVFVLEIGAGKHIAIPKLLSQEIKIGHESKRRKSYKPGDFKIVPSFEHCPHSLMYNPEKKELKWETGARTFKMYLSLPSA